MAASVLCAKCFSFDGAGRHVLLYFWTSKHILHHPSDQTQGNNSSSITEPEIEMLSLCFLFLLSSPLNIRDFLTGWNAPVPQHSFDPPQDECDWHGPDQARLVTIHSKRRGKLFNRRTGKSEFKFSIGADFLNRDVMGHV